MARTKELLAAGYVRDILFRSGEDLKNYILKLESRKQEYKILEQTNREDDTVIIRILQQYNTAPLIHSTQSKREGEQGNGMHYICHLQRRRSPGRTIQEPPAGRSLLGQKQRNLPPA